MHVVSMISSINVGFVLGGDRVSLSNLIDFSNFVDLFVLEDQIYCDEADIDVCFKPYFKDSANFPFFPIADNDSFSNVLFDIGVRTLSLYDNAPKQRTFSVDSYEYWLSLSTESKSAIKIDEEIPYFATGDMGRRRLLSDSKKMENAIIDLLEELGNTIYYLQPSSRNLCPFLDAFHQVETPILKLYNSIASTHRELVNKILELERPRAVYIPPLLSILLNRCNDVTDIPVRLTELRSEFSCLRQEIYYWQLQMSQKQTLKDQLLLRGELENSLSKISNKFPEKNLGLCKRIGGAFLDALGEGEMKKFITMPIAQLAREGLDLLPEKLSVRQFTGITKLFEDSLQVENYSGLLRKVFKNSLDISQYEITQSRKYFEVIRDRYHISFPALS